MIQFYLQQLLQESNNWISVLTRLVVNIGTNAAQYNFYLQENRIQLDNLIQQIQTYQHVLNSLLENNADNSYNLASSTHGILQERYQQLIGLSDHNLHLQRVFPVNENDWLLIDQPDQRFQVFKGCNEEATVGKIKILDDSSRVQALQAALIYAYQHITTLDYIDLSNNELNDIAMQFLSNALNNHNGYENIQLNACEALILSKNKVGKTGLEILLDAVAGNPLERHILLDGNMIDFDLDFFEIIVLPKTEQARLVNLDLTMNFILKGYMFNEGNIRIYYQKGRMETKLSERSISLEKRTTIKTAFFNHQNCLRSLPAKNSAAIVSLVASQDTANHEREIDFKWGVIGLFANKTTFPFMGEHAYLIVEGISKFGQRYLVRGDLYTHDGNTVSIRVSQCLPQDFLSFTGEGERIYCRTGTFEKRKIKAVLKRICESHLKQSFYDYAIRPNNNGHSINCIRWAVDILRRVSGNIQLDGWIPSNTVRHNSECHIL